MVPLPQSRPLRSRLLRLLTLLPRVCSQLPHSMATTASTQVTLVPILMALDTLVPTMAMPATHMLVPMLATPPVPLSQLIPQLRLLPRLSTLLPRERLMPPTGLPHMPMPMALPHTPMLTQQSTPLATQDSSPMPMVPLSQLSPLTSLLPALSIWPHTPLLKRRTN